MLTEDDKRHQWDGAALAGGALEVALLVAIASQLKKNGENGDYLTGGIALASVLPSIIARNKKPILQATQRDVEGSFLLNAYSDIDNAVPTAIRRQVSEWAKSEAGRLAKETIKDVKKPIEKILRTMEESARQGYYEAARAAKRYAPRIGYEKALEKSVTELARNGITSLSYVTKNGMTVRYPVDVALRETLTRAGKDRLDAQQRDMAKRLGINYVDVDVCGDARISHAQWEGKRYQLEGSGRYPNFDIACRTHDLVEGYGGFNCHHSYKLVRDPDAKYSFEKEKQHLEELARNGYTNERIRKLTTKQRRLQNELKKSKRVETVLSRERLPVIGEQNRKRAIEAKLRDLEREHKGVLKHEGWRENIYGKEIWNLGGADVPLYLSPKELKRINAVRDYAVIKVGVKEYTMSDHLMYQKAKERAVSRDDMVDALERPLFIDTEIRYNKDGKPSYRIYGERATLNINPETNVISTGWKTGQRTLRRYGKTT